MKTVSILALCLSFSIILSCVPVAGDADSFVKVENGKFVKDGKPYYFAGANMWYAAMLASDGEEGDRERLERELDCLDSMGVDNIRVLVGADGDNWTPMKVGPTLQVRPGVYNDSIFNGLDYLLAELGKRDMTAVLYLTNSWEWSGGFGQYLEWAGFGRTPLPKEVSWGEYCAILTQFYDSPQARDMYFNHVKSVVSRVNAITGRPYSEDPAIFSWQLCNEPRPFSDENKEDFLSWARESAAIIKSIDTNHLVSTGSEGLFGCEVDSSLFARLHSLEDIDYFNIHIWPYNWNWVDKGNLDSVDIAIDESRKYIGIHTDAVADAGKPLVIEEFGYPRDGFSFSKDSSVSARDIYYRYIFDIVIESARSGGCIAGCNFWAWGGYAGQSSESEYWRRGDDYCGDPAQEPQGLYSVYAGDSTTVELVRETNELIATATAGIEL